MVHGNFTCMVYMFGQFRPAFYADNEEDIKRVNDFLTKANITCDAYYWEKTNS